MPWTTYFSQLPPLAGGAVLLDESTSAVELGWLTPVLADTFTREAGDGWGAPDVGPAWQFASGVASRNFVTGGIGSVVHDAAGLTDHYFSAVSVLDGEYTGRVRFSISAPAGNVVDQIISLRRVDASNHYRLYLRLKTNGTIDLIVSKLAAGVGTTLQHVATGLAPAGGWLRFRFSATGTNPTTLRGRVWLDGADEPVLWDAEVEDSEAALQVAGGIQRMAVTPAGVTSLPITHDWDDLSVVNLALPGGTLPSVRFHAYRIWRTANGVRELAGELTNKASPFLVDWDAPTGVPLHYEITQWDGWQESAPIELDTQMLDEPRPFLVVVGDRDHAVPIFVLPDWGYREEAQMAIRNPLGRRTPLIRTGPTLAPSGQVRLHAPDEAHAQLLREIAALSRTGSRVIYKTDTGRALEVKLGTLDETHRHSTAEVTMPYHTVR